VLDDSYCHCSDGAAYRARADGPQRRQSPSWNTSLLSTRPHTHYALDDAQEQAELFANLFEWDGTQNPRTAR